MKKIILAFIMVMLFGVYSYADEVSDYCAAEPKEVGNSFTRFMSNVTGMNFLKTKAYETVIQNALKKEMNSKFNVEIKAFGANTLSNGKFEKITLESKNIESPYLYVTDFKAESLCSYNNVNFEDDKFYFQENFVGKFEGKITDSDLKKMLESKINKASKIDIKVAGISLFKILNPDVSIKNRRINIEMDVQYSNFIVSKTKKLKIDTALAIRNGELEFTDTHFGGNYTVNTQMVSSIMNLIDPFNRKIKIDDYNTAEIKIKNLEFKDDEIELEGIVIIPAYKKD